MTSPTPPQPAADDARLSQFLTEEVRVPAYADILLERAAAATRGETARDASGNAYAVTFRPGRIVVEHHWLEDWPPLEVPAAVFLAALRRHRADLG